MKVCKDQSRFNCHPIRKQCIILIWKFGFGSQANPVYLEIGQFELYYKHQIVCCSFKFAFFLTTFIFLVRYLSIDKQGMILIDLNFKFIIYFCFRTNAHEFNEMRNQNIGQPFTFLRTRTLNEGQPREHVDNSTSIEKRGQKIPQLRVLLWDSFLHFLLLYKDCGEKLGNQPSLPLTTLGKSFDCLFMSILGLIYFLLTFISHIFYKKDLLQVCGSIVFN